MLRTGNEKGKEIEPNTFIALKGHAEGNVPHHLFKPKEFKDLLGNFNIETLKVFENLKYETSEEWGEMSFFNILSKKK